MSHSPSRAEDDLIIRSEVPLPPFSEFRFRSLRELLQRPGEEDRPVIAGPVGDDERVVTLGELGAAAGRATAWARAADLRAGDSVLLARLPHTSEVPVAVALLGLMVAGIRVVLPMTVDSSIGRLVDATGCRVIVRSGVREETGPLAELMERVAAERGLPTECVNAVLTAPVGDPPTGLPTDREVLVLTTSGTTGEAKGVRYTERALLAGLEAWRASGLFSGELTGGPSLCPLLSHSMGVRNVLNAVATGQRTLLLYPEWMSERPDLVGRYLLTWPPRHVTAGPALLHALVRGMREVPEIGHALRRHLRCLVSSGSGFDSALPDLLPGVRIANAFGMTETQQVLNTLLSSGDGSPHRLGAPLPGVAIKVRFLDQSRQVGRLFVRSAFGFVGYVGEREVPDWFGTGDLVRWDGRELTFAGRAADDFLNTGLGVKTALADLERRYAGATGELASLVFFTAPARSGPVAVGFVGTADPADPQLQTRVRDALAGKHTHGTDGALDALEAVGLVPGWPPVRGVGKVDRERVSRDHAGLLRELGKLTPEDPRVVVLARSERTGSAFQRCAYPQLGQVLELVRLDRQYVTGEGNWLTSTEPKEAVLDLVGGYGANLLGHGHPAVRAAAVRALDGVPILDQGAVRGPAGELAEMLSERLYRETGRRFVVCLASTGAEAVELALKHALFARRERFTVLQDRLRHEFGPRYPVETDACLAHNSAAFVARRPALIALRGGFHGLTGGALHALGSDYRRRPFAELLGLRSVFLSPTAGAESLDQLDRTLADEHLELKTLRPGDSGAVTESMSLPDVLAVCVEPILGEGGIVEVPQEWLLRLKVPGVPLIMDEIQTGLGRTGAFLASAGVTADYYLFGKALGGGVAKVSAVAIERQHYCPAFDELRASTFSDDAFSAEVGKAVLTVIDGDDLATRAAVAGRRLLSALGSLRDEFPGVVRSVRGRGLMLGVELGLPRDGAFPLFRALGQGHLGYLGSSYLLNRHRIRALPTLSAPNVLRLEPSAYLSAPELAHAVAGLRALCRALAAGDVFELTRHLVTRDELDPAPYLGVSPFRQSADPPPPGAARVGFVFPSVYPDGEVLAAVPAYRALNPGQRCELVRRLHLILSGRPIVQYTRALFGGRVWLAGVFVPLLPEELERARATGATGRARDRLEEAVRVAAGLGCRAVVLGGQTSSVSADGTAVRAPDGVRLSTGNTFTVAVAVNQLVEECREAGITGSGSADRTAVVGAAGNIGSAMARALAGTAHGRRLVLVGRPGSEERLAGVVAQVRAAAPAAEVAVSTRLADLVDCNVMVVALGGSQPVLFPEHVAPDRPVVIVDVSQPRAVSPSVRRARPRALVRPAGFVRLPQDGDFRASPFTPPGVAFACLAEAVLIGLGATPDRLTGTIEPVAVESLTRLAERFGLLPSADVE